MPNEYLVKTGTQIAFYISGTFNPADDGTNEKIGAPTEVVFTMSALADAAGRQSTKVDLGAKRARVYEVKASVDFTDEVPDASGSFDVYWLPSSSSVEAEGNVGGNSGVDGAAPAGALGGITLAEFITLGAIQIGSLITHNGAVVQNGLVGYLALPSRYGQLLGVNNCGDAFEADNVEMGVFFNPLEDVDATE